jgi:hypothetical protein
MPPKNPWLNVNLRSNQIIANDPAEINAITNLAIKLKGYYALQLNILPEPFWGDLKNANVYILSGNPGYGKVEQKYNNDPIFVQATQDNITQNNPHIVWIDPNKPIDNGGKDVPHPGHDYWLKRTRVLREAIALQRNCNPEEVKLNICIIEYFPYHSKKISSAIKTKGKDLPSSKFVNNYIKNAIGEKWIVIARCKADWINRIPDLDTSKGNGKVLKTRSQQMYLTPRNLQKIDESVSLADNKSSTWDDFVEACKK